MKVVIAGRAAAAPIKAAPGGKASTALIPGLGSMDSDP
jgi:hypothetical protein